MSPHWSTLVTTLIGAVGHGGAANGPVLGDDSLLDFEEHPVSTSEMLSTSVAAGRSVHR
jgi:hypothetical protein